MCYLQNMQNLKFDSHIEACTVGFVAAMKLACEKRDLLAMPIQPRVLPLRPTTQFSRRTDTDLLAILPRVLTLRLSTQSFRRVVLPGYKLARRVRAPKFAM